MYWSEPSLWSSFDGAWDWDTWLRSPKQELPARLKDVVQRIAPLADSFVLGEVSHIALLVELNGGPTWNPVELLHCLRPQRATAVRLSTEGRALTPDDAAEFRLCRFESLPASAVRAVGRPHRLTSLSLDSWQLPQCTVDVLQRLMQLRDLRLRTRRLPPGCLAAVQQLADLRSLELISTMELGPVVQLSCLTRLTRLHPHQHNQAGVALQPPPVASLPHFQTYSFVNQRSPLQVRCQLGVSRRVGHAQPALPLPLRTAGRQHLIVHALHSPCLQMPGGSLEAAAFSSAGYHGGGAQLDLSWNWLTPCITSLACLLDALVPTGAELRLLKARQLGAGSCSTCIPVGRPNMPALCLIHPHRLTNSAWSLAKPPLQCAHAAS